jgi:hypothetical protein
MLRGHRSTYLSLFEPPMTVVVNNDAEKRGRSEALLLKRNNLLFHRHYYYVKIKRLQYQDLLDVLEAETFITQRTIIDITQRNTIALREVYKNRPDVKVLKAMFPHMNW